MSGRAKNVKRFERSNGLDTALYKNNIYLFFLYQGSYRNESWGSAFRKTQVETEIQ